MLFKVYLEKRPEEMKTTGLFYLSVIDKPVSNVWFKKTELTSGWLNYYFFLLIGAFNKP